jgi:methyl-accepting chemotaxis protein
MFAWSEQKANDDGVVWTGPYVSSITRKWVVACLRGVKVADKVVAVAGAELALDLLSEQALAFSFGSNATCWLQTGDGMLLATQPGGDAVLRVIPLSAADLPSHKHPDSKIKSEASLSESGAKDIVAALSRAQNEGQWLVPVGSEAGSARYLGIASLAGVNWQMCGITEYPTLVDLRIEELAEAKATAGRLPMLAAIALGCVVFGLLLGYLEARRISQPLLILTQRLRRSLSSKTSTPVSIAQDGEIGALASACQELLDQAFDHQEKD